MTLVPSRGAAAATVAHHLRLFGVPASADWNGSSERALVSHHDAEGSARVRVLLQPSERELQPFKVRIVGRAAPGGVLQFPHLSSEPNARARSLHAIDVYDCEAPIDVLATDASGRPCWIALRRAGVVVLIVGSDLGGDLLRYRQGDPERLSHRTDEAIWGFKGERPVYLFEHQVPAGSEHERPADVMAMALSVTVAHHLGCQAAALLPNDAPGMLVITGDDDQAHLEKYADQATALNGLPITYFLHPLTKHTDSTLAALRRWQRTELELHPDALEHPDRYDELFRTQATWFEHLTGAPPRLVRNHGFLNNGYWGHLPTWLAHGVRGSSNIPGVNGRVLNGSLLPARIAAGDQLTPHWSILTTIGDGVRFALGMSGDESAQCVVDAADRIVKSRLPGVLVLNLHPQNVTETIDMHRALHTVVERFGFLAVTFGECLDWFESRDKALAS